MSSSAWGTVAFLVAGGAVALAGLLLLLWSLLFDRLKTRGRLRRCPRCWYDMSKTEGLRCGECGHEARRESKLNKSRRRWRWAFAAILLILLGVGGIGWQRTRNFDWNTIKPVWLLLREGDGPSKESLQARKELVRRIKRNHLSDSQINTVVEKVLANQADPNAYWNGPTFAAGWGDVLEEIWDAGRLSDPQISRYARNVFANAFFAEARRTVRQGERVPFRIGMRQPRASIGWPSAQQKNLTCVIERMTIFKERFTGWPFTVGSFLSTGAGGWSEPRLDVELPVGVHHLTLNFDFAAFLNDRGDVRMRQGRHLADLAGAVTRWSDVRPVTVEVVQPDQSTMRLIPDEPVRSIITAAIEPEFISDTIMTQSGQYGGRHGMILVHPVPVNLSFDVFARVGDVERKIGAIAVAANQRGIDNAQEINAHPRSLFPDAETFDLILRARPDAAEKTIDIFEAWDGEIVIKDVPLREHTPTTAPAR